MGPHGPSWKEAINQFAILAVDGSGKQFDEIKVITGQRLRMRRPAVRAGHGNAGLPARDQPAVADPDAYERRGTGLAHQSFAHAPSAQRDR